MSLYTELRWRTHDGFFVLWLNFVPGVLLPGDDKLYPLHVRLYVRISKEKKIAEHFDSTRRGKLTKE